MQDDQRRRAVEDAYAAHRDDVYRLAYAILGDPEEAGDATQDCFARAFQRWDRYDGDRPLRPWLHAIAGRIALDALRRRRVRRLSVPEIGRQEAARSDGPYGGHDPAKASSRRESVEQALAALRPVPRAVVLLRYRYGYDYAEIGRLLDLSANNVGVLLTRARAQMRERLERDTDAPPRQEVRG